MSATSTTFSSDHFAKIQDLDIKIRMEAPFIDFKPYSHNLVGLYLRDMIKLCEGTTYLDNVLLSTPLPIMGWKHLLSDEKLLTDEVEKQMKRQLKIWRDIAHTAIFDDSDSESDDE